MRAKTLHAVFPNQNRATGIAEEQCVPKGRFGLSGGAKLPQDLGDLCVSPPLGPSQSGGPWRVIRETGGQSSPPCVTAQGRGIRFDAYRHPGQAPLRIRRCLLESGFPRANTSPASPHHPRRHTPLILNHSSLQRVNHLSAQVVYGVSQQRLVDQISF